MISVLSLVWWLVPLAVVSWATARAVHWAWLKPKRLERILREQGIEGARYKLLVGEAFDVWKMGEEAKAKPMPLSHDIIPRVLPLVHQGLLKYGKVFVTWLGPYPIVTITDPEAVVEVMSNKFGHFQKPPSMPAVDLLATGLARYEGEKWAKHRRIINPAFHVEKLKNMVPAFSACCTDMISRWVDLIGSEEKLELDVLPELQTLTSDAISRTAFGSSYQEGKRIFQLQTEQAQHVLEVVKMFFVPGYSYFPTKRNRRMREIHREVKSILTEMIQKRENDMKRGSAGGDDLLGLLLESNTKERGGSSDGGGGITVDDVIEECKLFYFAGQETTNLLLTWTMVLLGMHPSWQDRARDEVLQIFGKDKKPDSDGLSHMKIVTMVLQEALRLYPPGVAFSRSTYKGMTTVGQYRLPPGVTVLLPILHTHHDKDLWGEDAGEFNPHRFSEGVSRAARRPHAYLPFGWGPRICVGQSFAMMEARMALAMILQSFCFELSPSYIHAPLSELLLQPQHGAQIIIRKL